MKKDKLKKNIAFFIFAILFCSSVWQFMHAKFRSPSHLAELREEFDKIPLPETATLTSSVINASKGNFQVVSQNFNTSISEVEVVNFYEKTLLLHGWRIKNSPPQIGGEITKAYCKNDIDAVIQITKKKNHQTLYYFGIEWQQGLKVKTGCKD